MTLITTGLNHKCTPLEMLGKVIIPKDRLNTALNEIMRLPTVSAAVILITCNRCEIYADVETTESLPSIGIWLTRFSGVAQDIFQDYGFTLTGRDAIQHLLRVSCSLESMIMGESQILGQIKEAYQVAQTNGAVNKNLARLFEHALSTAKQVRHQTEIGKHPVSFASAAVDVSKKLFEKLDNKYALMIGTGEMAQLTAQHFINNGLGHITISGRSPEKMRELAIQFQGETLPLDKINEHLSDFDIVVSATAGEPIILSKSAVEQALRKRKHMPMYLVDLALPHDIESSVSKFEDVYLYTLETLARIVNHNHDLRLGAATHAETIIQSKINEYFEWMDSNRAIGVVNQLRNEAERLKEESLQQALKQLHSGKAPEEVLNFLATTLSNRLTHQPTQWLKNIATGENPFLLQEIERLLRK